MLYIWLQSHRWCVCVCVFGFGGRARRRRWQTELSWMETNSAKSTSIYRITAIMLILYETINISLLVCIVWLSVTFTAVRFGSNDCRATWLVPRERDWLTECFDSYSPCIVFMPIILSPASSRISFMLVNPQIAFSCPNDNFIPHNSLAAPHKGNGVFADERSEFSVTQYFIEPTRQLFYVVTS